MEDEERKPSKYRSVLTEHNRFDAPKQESLNGGQTPPCQQATQPQTSQTKKRKRPKTTTITRTTWREGREIPQAAKRRHRSRPETTTRTLSQSSEAGLASTISLRGQIRSIGTLKALFEPEVRASRQFLFDVQDRYPSEQVCDFS